MHQAKKKRHPSLSVWGTGNAIRDFLYVDDCADAVLFLLQTYESPQWINISSHTQSSISELALSIRDVVQFEGEIVFDTTYPDGMPKKVLCHKRLSDLGWKPSHSLKEGLEKTYRWATKEKQLL